MAETRFMPAFFLPVVERGQIFEPGKWPHHITLFPPLESAYDPEFGEEMRRELNPHEPFSVRTGGTAYFGPESDVPVRLIQPSLSLQGVHYLIERAIGRLQHDKTYRAPYNPHITVEKFLDVRKGKKIVIAGLSIVEKTDNGWTVVDKVGLRGQEAA